MKFKYPYAPEFNELSEMRKEMTTLHKLITRLKDHNAELTEDLISRNTAMFHFAWSSADRSLEIEWAKKAEHSARQSALIAWSITGVFVSIAIGFSGAFIH